MLCCKGQGVKQDYLAALEWLTKAADQGHCKAQHNIGMFEKYCVYKNLLIHYENEKLRMILN